MSRFKYWAIFLVSVFSVQLFFIFGVAFRKGWKEAINIIFINDFNPFIFIGIPVLIGFFAIILVSMGSWLNSVEQKEEIKK